MKKIILTACLIALTAGCKKKVPVPEPVPAPKAEAGETSGAASTRAVTMGGMLAAPGNYVRTTVGQVQKAQAAKALFETTAKEESKSLDLNDTGGN